MIWETEEDIGGWRRKLKIVKDGNDSLWIEHKEEIKVIYYYYYYYYHYYYPRWFFYRFTLYTFENNFGGHIFTNQELLYFMEWVWKSFMQTIKEIWSVLIKMSKNIEYEIMNKSEIYKILSI